jgi:hypothetical protein
MLMSGAYFHHLLLPFLADRSGFAVVATEVA